MPGLQAGHPTHEQVLVVGVPVPDGRDHREPHGLGIESPTGGAAPDPSAVPGGRVLGDPLRPVGRASGELLPDGRREVGGQLVVLDGAPVGVPEPASFGLLLGSLVWFTGGMSLSRRRRGRRA